MLVLLPPGLVPLAVLAAQLPRDAGEGRAGARRPARLLLPIADSAFSVAPALVFLAGRPGGVWTTRGVILAALAALMVVRPGDLVRCGCGSAWAWTRGRAARVRVALRRRRVPRARSASWPRSPARRIRRCCRRAAARPACWSLFAHERRGRIDNALELQRAAQEGRERLQTIVSNSSDCIMIVGPDGTLKMLTGSVAPIFGADWDAGQGAPLLDWVHERGRGAGARVRAAVAAKPVGEPHEAEWRMRYADGALPARRRRRHEPARRRARRAASSSPCATSRPARRSRSSCATARSTTR